jgi:hypothetical protein
MTHVNFRECVSVQSHDKFPVLLFEALTRPAINMIFFGLTIDIHNSEKAEVLHLIKCISSKDECTTKASDHLQSATGRLLESDSNSNSNSNDI